jgi:uncharacterized protein (TIGR00661 family)
MKILFGVFDWGLGHATRDIPLIQALIEKNQVHIISTGRALKILQEYFGEKCGYYDVPSLYPPYTKTPFFKINFTLTCPKMLVFLYRARKETEKIIHAEKFDKVISDCRYDTYDNPENSYLINHQLRFKTPYGAEWAMESWLAWRMKKYKYIIVPDYDKPNLSGRLSHNLRYLSREKIKYIGIISHIRKLETAQDIDYFVSLSGPEPQRSILQRKIITQLEDLSGKIVIAGGNPDDRSSSISQNVEIYGYLRTPQQENIMNRSKFIITRSGYTTIMELAELDKKQALLIPTPGQSEQEYLADIYEKQKMFHHVSQYRLKLKRDIEIAQKFSGFDAPWKTEESVKKFLETVEA